MRHIIAAALLVAGCATHNPQPLSEGEARTLLSARPEIKAFFTRMIELSGGSVHGMMMTELADERSFTIYVGEDHDDHTVLWQRYRVYRVTRKVVPLDEIGDEVTGDKASL